QIGGVVAGIESGYFQREIAESAYRYQQQLDRKDRIVVGVNAYEEGGRASNDILAIDPRWEREHLARLSRIRAERDAERVAAGLANLRRAADGAENLMPPILDCVRAYCTLGEIVDALRSRFGEYREDPVV
ncbi:MAG: methylmalonyl-CoA mutase family protein, partial [Chloroflexota bacterium]